MNTKFSPTELDNLNKKLWKLFFFFFHLKSVVLGVPPNGYCSRRAGARISAQREAHLQLRSLLRSNCVHYLFNLKAKKPASECLRSPTLTTTNAKCKRVRIVKKKRSGIRDRIASLYDFRYFFVEYYYSEYFI